MAIRVDDLPDGTMLYNNKHDIFLRLDIYHSEYSEDDERSWYAYHREHRISINDEDINLNEYRILT